MTGDTINLSGDFRGANVNVKSTLSYVAQSVSTMHSADQSAKDELQSLIQQLNDALQQAPQRKAEEAEAVAETAKVLMESASKEKPNKTLLQISGNGLVEAAKVLAEVVPTALPIAMKIAAAIAAITA